MTIKSRSAALAVIIAVLVAGCRLGQMSDERVENVVRVF